MPTRALAVPLALALALPHATARASDPRPEVELVPALRLDVGLDDRDGLILGIPTIGVDWRVADSLVLGASLLAVVPVETDAHERAGAGAGGGLSVRVVPFQNERVEPWLGVGAGLVLFPGDPFLPGGDVYEFILTYGVGFDVRLDGVTLGAEVHYTHLSNGQGLGDHNPAYDGLGLSLAARFALSQPAYLESAWDRYPEPTGARPCFELGWTVDGAVGRVDDVMLWTGRLRFAERISPNGLVVVDLEGGTLADERLLEGGVALVEHVDVASFGVHVGYRDFVGLGTLVAALQAELHLGPQVSLVAMGQVEAGDFTPVLSRAALGLRAFPFPSLAIDLGVGFDRIGDAASDDVSDPYFAAEWQVPIDLGDWQFGIFVERRVDTIDQFGLRIAYTGAGHVKLRDVARHTDWRRLR